MSFLSVKVFMVFNFLCNVSARKSLFNRQLCKRKTQSKKRNDSRKIACFWIFRVNFHDFPFFMQRFCSVNNILITNYTKVKQRFYPVNHILIANYASVKSNQKSAMTAGTACVTFLRMKNLKILMISFFMQGFCAVYLALITSYSNPPAPQGRVIGDPFFSTLPPSLWWGAAIL